LKINVNNLLIINNFKKKKKKKKKKIKKKKKKKRYTSLGGTNNTIKNPALKIETDNGEEKYEPAYKLKDGSLERMGRIRKPASPRPLR